MLRIKKIKFFVKSTGGIFYQKISFKSGLNIIWGQNTSGKSLCVNGILYGLGCEILINKQIGPKALKPALTRFIEKGNKKYNVIESYILLAIQNKTGNIITIKRQIIGKPQHFLVKVYPNDTIEKDLNLIKNQEYYVRRSNAAKNLKGFHRYLIEDFLKLNLPFVETFKETSKPRKLYFEQLMSLMFIEQIKGWVSIGNNIPAWGVKNVLTKTLEYILRFDVTESKEKRRYLTQKLKLCENKWYSEVEKIREISRDVGGIIDPDPKSISEYKNIEFNILIPSDNDTNISLDKYFLNTKGKYNSKRTYIEKPRPISDKKLKEKLNEFRQKNVDLDIKLKDLTFKLTENRKLIDKLVTQEKMIRKEIKEYSDIKILLNIGSKEELLPKFKRCPICNSKINDNLLVNFSKDQFGKPMKIEDNINYLKEEKKTIEFLAKHTKRIYNQQLGFRKQLENENHLILDQIKDVNLQIINSQATIDISKIRETIILEEKIKKLRKCVDEVILLNDNINKYYQQFLDVRNILKNCVDVFSFRDEEKIEFIEKVYKENLKKFGFSSSATPDLEISKDTYLPVFENFVANSEYSATDLIRKIWAYYLSLLELSLNFQTNHLMFLVFDEPGQQRIKSKWLDHFYSKILTLDQTKMQVIIATSQEKQTIERHVQSSVNFIEIEEDTRFLKLME